MNSDVLFGVFAFVMGLSVSWRLLEIGGRANFAAVNR